MAQNTKDMIKTVASIIAVLMSLMTAGYTAGVNTQRIAAVEQRQNRMDTQQDNRDQRIERELEGIRKRLDQLIDRR